MALYPVNLKLEGRLCVVIGGGQVAERKSLALLAAGASVRVIAPAVTDCIAGLAQEEKVEWFQRVFAEGDLEGTFLAFAATNVPEVQLAVEAEAKRRGVLLNSADTPQGSDFHVPAHFRRGRVLVTVATGGGSPAFAKVMREKLEGVITPDYAMIVELLGMVREKIVGLDDDSDGHALIFTKLLDAGLVEVTCERDWFSLQKLLLGVLPKEVDAATILREFIEMCD